jgi:cytochrome c oxidase subunit 2
MSRESREKKASGVNIAGYGALSIAIASAFGCRGSQNVLNPGGVQASHMADLWWFYFWITLIIYFLVLVFLIAAVIRTTRKPFIPPGSREILTPEPTEEKRKTIIVCSAVGLSLATLFVLFLADLFTGKSLHSLRAADALTIKITGHQWWWEAVYEHPIPSNQVTTANEIHLPVGKAVKIELQSHDVIHSFWVPNLHGKKDLIPGHPTTLWIQADKAGVYRGQCAEFCGHQHAHMRLIVVAEDEKDFQRWMGREQTNAHVPETEGQIQGEKIFLQSTCVMCHTIQGTLANAKVGPNLTHLASRKMLAAGRVSNARNNLAAWILDPQHLKPGVQMPRHNLSSDQLGALLDYLESLK